MTKQDILDAIDSGTLQGDFLQLVEMAACDGEAKDFVEDFKETLIEMEEEELISFYREPIVDGKLLPEFLGDILLTGYRL